MSQTGFSWNNPRYYNIAKIPSLNLIYRIKDDGECCYLYLKSLNGEFKIYKQSHDGDGNDYRRMIHETMCGGDNFAEFQSWYYSHDIENFESIGDIELNDINAKNICYKNNECKYLNGSDKINQNINDITFMINMYLTDINYYITSSHHIQTCMIYYKIFNHSPNTEYSKMTHEQYHSFISQNAQNIDDYDMFTDVNPQFMNDTLESYDV